MTPRRRNFDRPKPSNKALEPFAGSMALVAAALEYCIVSNGLLVKEFQQVTQFLSMGHELHMYHAPHMHTTPPHRHIIQALSAAKRLQPLAESFSLVVNKCDLPLFYQTGNAETGDLMPELA
eukprot:scaffold12087_cov25-Tisochrysis_lutea.AAC.1